MSGIDGSPLGGRRATVLAVLGEAGEPLSTTEVRERLNRGRERALVAEQVYRALAALERGGYVRRVQSRDRGKHSGTR